jgi:hypothetical protein
MSVPLEYHGGELWGWPSREAEVPAGFGVRTLAPRSQRLWEVIPDDPDYQKYVPLEYRLDAKRIVGDLAQDLQRGKSAHIWVELAHLGIAAVEIAAETSTLVAGLGLAGPVLGMVGSLLAIGAGYQEAAEKIAEDSSASGYSRGVAMAANKRSVRLLREYFGNLLFTNSFFPEGAKVAKANHNAGLVAGYLHGRVLTDNQRVIFWRDLGRRMGDQSYRGPSAQWSSKDWRDWYTDAAGYFRRYHLTA